MGLTLLQNAEARGYYENKTKGDYVIRLKGPYDVAVNKQKDSTFALTCDWWAGHRRREGIGNAAVVAGPNGQKRVDTQ